MNKILNNNNRKLWFGLAALTAVMNMVDAITTALLINWGLAKEINPLMRWLMEQSDLSFMITKICGSILLLSFGWYGFYNRNTKLTLLIAFGMYGGVMLWDLLNFSYLFFRTLL